MGMATSMRTTMRGPLGYLCNGISKPLPAIYLRFIEFAQIQLGWAVIWSVKFFFFSVYEVVERVGRVSMDSNDLVNL